MKKVLLVFALLLCAGAVHAQTFDIYGGWLNASTNCTWPNSQALTLSAVSRDGAGNGSATVSSTASIIVGEQFYLNGTGTPMDGGRFRITSETPTVVSFAAAGGAASSSSGQLQPARWYTQKVSNRWQLCTPLGHWMFGNGVYATILDNATDYQGINDQTVVTAKYASNFGLCTSGNGILNWACSVNIRMQDWGFNLHVEPGNLFVYPTTVDGRWSTADQTIPVKNATIPQLNTGVDGVRNVFNLLVEPFKDTIGSFKQSVYGGFMSGNLDLFDSKVKAEFQGEINPATGIVNYVAGPSNDWIVGFFSDEGDNTQGFRTGPDYSTQVGTTQFTFHDHSDPHWGWITLISTPVKGAALQNETPKAIAATDQVFADNVFHSKVELGTWLQQAGDRGPNYATIAALNAVWGSTYDSFGSDASTFTGESVGTGNGSTLSFAHTLAHTTGVTPYTLQIFLNGVVIAGDDAVGPRASSPTTSGNFRSFGAAAIYKTFAINTALLQNMRLVDSNSNIEIVKTAGTTGGSTPTWSTGIGQITTSGGVTFVNIGNGPINVSSSTINYSTGAIVVAFNSGQAPATGIAITVNYQTNGWGIGNGLLDEAGQHSWVTNADPWLVGTGIQNVAADNATCASAGICQTNSTTVTVTTASPHGYSGGQSVFIGFTGDGRYGGTHTIASTPTSTTFTYTASIAATGTHTGGGQCAINSPIKADLDNFLYHFAKKRASDDKSAIQTVAPGMLYFGPDLLSAFNSPGPAPVLQAFSPYVDVVSTNIPPFDPSNIFVDTQSRLDFFGTNIGDLPWQNWVGWWGQADSYMSPFPPAPGTQVTFATQALRGSYYQTYMNAMLNATLTATGTKPMAAFGWWTWNDSRAEQANWGLVTRRDNAYDGVESVTATVTCQWITAKSCGGELGVDGAPYGNFIGPVKTANATWVSMLPPATFNVAVNTTNPSSGVTINYTPHDNSGGTSCVSPCSGLNFNSGSSEQFTFPTTASGNNLTSITGCDSVSGNLCNKTVNSNVTLTGIYTNPTFTLTVNSTSPSSGVAMTVSPTDNNGHSSCSTSCILVYNTGTSVTVTAPSTSGTSTFSSWTGCDSVVSTACTKAVSANVIVTANYTVTTFTVGVHSTNPSTGVTVSLSPADNGGHSSCSTPCSLVYNSGVTLTATVSSTNFTNWASCPSPSANVCTVTAISGNQSFTANYTSPPPPTFTLTVQSVTPATGVVVTASPTDSGGHSTVTTLGSLTYPSATSVNLTAPTTAGGNNFASWAGCDSVVTNVCTVAMGTNRTVIVTYTPPSPTGPTVPPGKVPLSVTSLGAATLSPPDANGNSTGTAFQLTNAAYNLTFNFPKSGQCKTPQSHNKQQWVCTWQIISGNQTTCSCQ